MALPHSRSLPDDVMRVSIRDLNGHLIRVLDLKIVPGIVLQGRPGVQAWSRRMTSAIWKLWKSA